MKNTFLSVIVCLAIAARIAAQPFDFPAAAAEDPATLAKAIPVLAEQLIAVYKDDDRATYLDNLFRLQMVAGRYDDGARTLDSLRALRANRSPRQAARDLQYLVLARTKSKEPGKSISFADAFRDFVGGLDNRTSGPLIRAFTVNEGFLRQDLDEALASRKGKSTISPGEALALIRAYQIDEAYRVFAPLITPLVEEDDRRRYVIEKDIPVKTPDGATVCALMMRPRSMTGRLPTLMQFTIYADPGPMAREARSIASNGYVSVIGFTRGKACSPDAAVPYEHDGADAAALIDWITGQSWSDGRVGMYGGSYSGFTSWAAAKHMPKGLKAIMVGAPGAPGVDVPMEGNVVWNFVYPWPFYTTNNKTVDDATYGDRARWRRLNHDWYVSGRAYRDLDKIDGSPNPIFDRWIAHPSYDAYWQSVIPYRSEFARIDIPVLSTAGYYFGGPGAAVYYFTQHIRYNPGAEHYLLIGPYDHIQAQRGTSDLLGPDNDVLAGYKLDPTALIDMSELRDQWFDYVFRNGPKPAMLQDKVNYQVTGANVWKHAPSLASMANGKMRFHLSRVRDGSSYRLSEQKPPHGASITQTVNFADRSDADRVIPGGGVLDKDLDTSNGFAFVSDPFTQPVEMSGLFSGEVSFVTNKKDFDFNIALFELTPEGAYMQLAPYWARASYVRDATHRHLLMPGKRQSLAFQSVRLMSHQLRPGSRLVVVLGVIKDPGQQINYGTGNDVNAETIADAKVPLRIRWLGDSYVDVPVRR